MKNLKNLAPFFARVIHNISGWMLQQIALPAQRGTHPRFRRTTRGGWGATQHIGSFSGWMGGWISDESFYYIEASKMLIKIVDMTRTGRDRTDTGDGIIAIVCVV